MGEYEILRLPDAVCFVFRVLSSCSYPLIISFFLFPLLYSPTARSFDTHKNRSFDTHKNRIEKYLTRLTKPLTHNLFLIGVVCSFLINQTSESELCDGSTTANRSRREANNWFGEAKDHIFLFPFFSPRGIYCNQNVLWRRWSRSIRGISLMCQSRRVFLEMQCSSSGYLLQTKRR